MSNDEENFEIPDGLDEEIINFLSGPKPETSAERQLSDALGDLSDQIQLPRTMVLSVLKYELDLIETLEDVLTQILQDAGALSAEENKLYDEIKRVISTRKVLNYINTATVNGLGSV